MKWLLFSAIASVAFAQQAAPSLASLEGRVTDTRGQPIRKASLILRPAGPGVPSSLAYSASSDEEGKFSFEEIAPGSYSLRADRVGYLARNYRARAQETFSTLTLAAGQHLNEINLALTPEATISGRVLDEDGDPVASVTVRLQSGPGMTMASAPYTDGSGKYSIPGLSAGKYYLSASVGSNRAFSIIGMRAGENLLPDRLASSTHPEEFYATTFYPNERDQRTATPIQVDAGQQMQGIDIHLKRTPAFAVRGRVSGTVPGHPLEQCQISLLSDDLPPVRTGLSPGGGTTGQILRDGSFSFRSQHFPPGNYSLTVSCTRAVIARQGVVIADRAIDEVLTLQPLLDLRGTVSIEGEPHPDFKIPNGGNPATILTTQVFLYFMNDPLLNSPRAEVKDDGSFLISNVAPGAYEVRVSPTPGGTYLKSVRLGPNDARDNQIEVTAETAMTSLQVTLSRSMGTIEGVIQSNRGKLLGGSVVTLLSDPPRTEGRYMLSGVGENGRFTLTVPPGTYRLYAWEDLATAQYSDPEFLKPYEPNSLRVIVGENGRVQVTLKEIPATPEPRQ